MNQSRDFNSVRNSYNYLGKKPIQKACYLGDNNQNYSQTHGYLSVRGIIS